MIAAVTDRKACRRPFMDQVRAIASAGPDMIILREKDLPETEYEALARECLRICEGHGVELCINSFARVAARMGLSVQLPMGALRHGGHAGIKRVAASVHSVEEALEAQSLGAGMLIFGNVFETLCKPGEPAKGLGMLESVCAACRAPVLAIGGMDQGNMAEAVARGATGVCMRGAMMTGDPSEIVGAYRRLRMG